MGTPGPRSPWPTSTSSISTWATRGPIPTTARRRWPSPTAGALWDAAAKKRKSIRVYGEFCGIELARFEPKPKDWFEVWEDRKNGSHKFKMTADTAVPGLKPYINREVHYWPLLQSDQHRADVFIREYQEFSRRDAVPDLTILSLPCDHSEGVDPHYPTPRAMMADNDLALGRVVEAVSNSPQWKETCIFVIEDDAQAGPDHVDGHRTVFMVISPYTRRKFVDSAFYAQTSMIRSIEMILGLDPMNRFDALADPITTCFNDEPDLTPYRAVPNNTPLDERNPPGTALNEQDRFWLEKTPRPGLEPHRRPGPLLAEPDHLVFPPQGRQPLSRPPRRGTGAGRGSGLKATRGPRCEAAIASAMDSADGFSARFPWEQARPTCGRGRSSSRRGTSGGSA